MTLFRDIAKQVHPDMSTHSQHASADKFREAFKHRNEPAVLLELARKWGLQLDGSFDSKTFDRNASEAIFEAVVGAIVKHNFSYNRGSRAIYGVIIKIRKITKGYRKGANEFKLYDFKDGTIWTLKTFEKQPFDKVVGMADKFTLNEGKDKLDNIVQSNKTVAKIRQARADDFFANLGLKKNKNYMGSGLRVLVEYKNDIYRWEVLIRTTPKSVYIPSGSKERRIPIHSVRQIKMVA
jgi:hypothetical protein